MSEVTWDIHPNRRLLGKVDWFGGSTREGKKLNYGFITLLSDVDLFPDRDVQTGYGSSAYVNRTDLNCKSSDLVKGTLITFRLFLQNDEKVKAVEVDLFSNETDAGPLIDFLNDTLETQPVKDSLNVCSRFSVQDHVSARPVIAKVVQRIDQAELWETSFGFTDFPEVWFDPDSPFYDLIPTHIRKEQLFDSNADLQQSISDLANRFVTYPETKFRASYTQMCGEHEQLALSWASGDSDYEKAKMLSARFAELKTAEFFRVTGHVVEDVALHQLTRKTEEWKNYDLLVDDVLPIDVKNARHTFNGTQFVQYTVKRFKTDQSGQDVKVFGVLSPYLKFDDIRLAMAGDEPVYDDVTILGETSAKTISTLQVEFSKRNLRVLFGLSDKWPVWVFNNKLEWYEDQKRALILFKDAAKKIRPNQWSCLNYRPLPQFLISGMIIPEILKQDLLPWQIWYLAKLEDKAKNDGLTLPWLYLFTFQHFIEAMTNLRSAEDKEYSPKGYEVILFGTVPGKEPEFNCGRPAGLIDHVAAMGKLINALTILWSERRTTQLETLRDFVLKDQGLLRASNPFGKQVTVLAYCGGWITKLGRCGNFPLILGKHITCESCGMLICDECGHCSDQCKVDREPLEENTDV